MTEIYVFCRMGCFSTFSPFCCCDLENFVQDGKGIELLKETPRSLSSTDRRHRLTSARGSHFSGQ